MHRNGIFRFSGILVLLCTFCLLTACSRAYRQACKDTEAVKKHGLAFRLQDDLQRVAYYRDRGLNDQARAEQENIALRNRELVKSFQDKFDFCPLHFYYASQQADLLAGKPVLLNGALEPDASIPLPDTMLLANFAPGAVIDNGHKGVAFRVVGTAIEVKPTFQTARGDRPVQRKDVWRVNRKLHKMNESKYN